ncbi:8405_t:CDS:10, partial [Ambispora gerdemannii]
PYPGVKDREKLDKLADYGNKILALIFVEDKLLAAEELLKKSGVDNEEYQELISSCNEIITVSESGDEYAKEILSLEKDGKKYSKLITDAISELEKKIGGRQEESEENLGAGGSSSSSNGGSANEVVEKLKNDAEDYYIKKADIRERGDIVNIMNHVNGDLIPAINKLSEADNLVKAIEIPLDIITGRGDAGIIINNGQEESLGDRHFASYNIEPVTISLTNGNDIVINRVLLNYRRDNFDPYACRNEEEKDLALRAEIPGFVDENDIDNDRMIGESKIVQIGSASYELGVYDDYTLTAADGQKFYFSERSLSALLSEARCLSRTSHGGHTNPEVFRYIVNDIKEHPEFCKLAMEEQEKIDNELQTLLSLIIAKEHKKNLSSSELVISQLEECRQLLTDIQTILTKNEDNIAEFLTSEEKERIKISLNNAPQILKEIINDNGRLFDKACLVNEYLEYYDIDNLKVGELATARQFYKEFKGTLEEEVKNEIKSELKSAVGLKRSLEELNTAAMKPDVTYQELNWSWIDYLSKRLPKKKNNGYQAPKFAGTLGGKDGKLDKELIKLTEKIDNLKRWEQGADVEIAEYPPYTQPSAEPVYYRGFRRVYRGKEAVKKELERIKRLAKKNADDYEKAEQKINSILIKDINNGYDKITPYITGFENGSAPATFGLDLEAIEEDIKKLKKNIPQDYDSSNRSLSEENLSLVQQKVFANNKDLSLNRLLWLEKKYYLEKNKEELNGVELAAIEGVKEIKK